jgi:hypothetical protein
LLSIRSTIAKSRTSARASIALGNRAAMIGHALDFLDRAIALTTYK